MLLRQPTFDNFIVGEPCRAAMLAAREAARSPGTRYNPLFLFGGTGTGKTHLLRAISAEMTARDPSAQIYLDSYATFTTRLEAALEAGQAASLRERFSYYDAFLLDDIPADEPRATLQQEIIGWIDRYVGDLRQVVLTCAHPLSRLMSFEERLVSRIREGLVVPLGGLDSEARATVAARMLEREGMAPRDGVLQILGDLPVTDMREMIGLVNRVGIAMRAEGADPGPAWLTTMLQRLVRDGELRRFRVTARDLPSFGTGVTRVEVAMDGEERLVEVESRVAAEAAAAGETGPAEQTGRIEPDADAGEPGPDSVEVESAGARPDETEGLVPGEAFLFDESEGYVLDWDREEDRLLNDL